MREAVDVEGAAVALLVAIVAIMQLEQTELCVPISMYAILALRVLIISATYINSDTMILTSVKCHN